MYDNSNFQDMFGSDLDTEYLVRSIVHLQKKFRESKSGSLRLEEMLTTGDSWKNMACVDKLNQLGYIRISKDSQVSNFREYRNIRLTTEQDLIERKVSNKRVAMRKHLNSLKVSKMSLTQLNNLEAALRGF